MSNTVLGTGAPEVSVTDYYLLYTKEVNINQIITREGIRGEGPSLSGQEVQMMKAGPGVSRLREGTERKGSMLGGAGTGRTPVLLRN